jgi:pimeloyl-ACP methyl ester carboxylesterase
MKPHLLRLSLLFTVVGCSPNIHTRFPANVVAIDSGGSLRHYAGDPGVRSHEFRSGGTRMPADDNQTLKNEVKLVSSDDKKLGEDQKSASLRYTSNSASHLQIVFGNDEIAKHDTILIFIHGGLNTPAKAVDRANKLTRPIMTDAVAPAYPIFVCWNANLYSSWAEQYETHRGAQDRVFGGILAPFTFVSNVGRMVSRLPLSVIEQAYGGYRTLRATTYDGQTVARFPLSENVKRQYRKLTAAGYDVRFSTSAPTSDLWVRGTRMTGEAIPKTVAEGVVDTGGKVGWDFMVRRTRTMFTKSNPGFDPGGMDLFCKELCGYMKQHPEKKLVLVGHSMGTIVANEMLRRYGNQLAISDIVYLAAACGVDDFDRNVVPYLLTHTNSNFYNLSLHPANDCSEAVGGIFRSAMPRGSLLDWIDFYYSSTDTDYGWTLGKWENCMLGSSRFVFQQDYAAQTQLKHQLHLKAFGFGDERTYGPQHHGGFDQWRFWRPDFYKTGDYDPELRHHYLDKEKRKVKNFSPKTSS